MEKERALTNNPIPVILDTDIGADIDDTWALAILLRSSELDLKLVTTTVTVTLGEQGRRTRVKLTGCTP